MKNLDFRKIQDLGISMPHLVPKSTKACPKPNLTASKKKKSRGFIYLLDSGGSRFLYSASLCKFQLQKKYKKFWFSFFHDFFDMFCCDFSLKKFENHQFSLIFIDFREFSVKNHNKTCEKSHEKMKTEKFCIFFAIGICIKMHCTKT